MDKPILSLEHEYYASVVYLYYWIQLQMTFSEYVKNESTCI